MAAPDVAVTSVSQSPSRMVTVTYDLSGEDAVVTLDVQTNTLADARGDWVSIGLENVRFCSGDVNRKVSQGTGKVIRWAARRSWPDQDIQTPTVRAVVKAWALDDPPDYLVVDLKGSKNVRYYEDVRQLPSDKGLADDLYRTSELVLRRVHARNVEWYMGSPSSELGRNTTNWDALETRHAVTLTNDYYLGVFELTRQQYANVCGGAVADGEGTLPLNNVAWNTMRGNAWPEGLHTVTAGGLKTFRDRTGVSTWDLPTEAQWEFACRAGTTSALYSGDELEGAEVETSERLEPLAWYSGNSGGAPHRVGEKAPNAWGFCDMYGNVSEFCLDWFTIDLGAADATEPIGAAEGTYRAVRGGRFTHAPKYCRSAARENFVKPTDAKTYFGFRLLCDCRAE